MTRSWPSDESVLVIANDAPACVTCLRSLGRRGVRTIVASETASSPGFASRYCDEAILLPSPADELLDYKDALVTLASREDVRTVVPVREEDAYVLSRYRSEFVDHVGAIWPSMEQLRSVHDRIQLIDAAEEAGVPVPRTKLLDEVEDWSREQIVKARYAILVDEYVELPPDESIQTRKTRYLEPGTVPDVEAIMGEMGHVPIVQEYVHGTEYCFRGLYDDGELVATSQKRLLRGMKYPRGPSVYHEAVDVPELEATGRALLDHLDWNGVASVGFIREPSGTFKLLEVNPRFWASLPVDVHAGVDFPYYYWQLAGGATVDADTAYRPGVATHFLHGELLHLHSVLTEDYPLVERPRLDRTARDVAASLYTNPTFDYLSLDDPGPFLRDALNLARSVLR